MIGIYQASELATGSVQAEIAAISALSKLAKCCIRDLGRPPPWVKISAGHKRAGVRLDAAWRDQKLRIRDVSLATLDEDLVE